MNPGFRIRTAWKRPAAELVEKFAGIASADIDDAMFRMAAMHKRVRPVNGAPLLGTAFTVRLRPGDNLLFHKAIDMAQPGDVLVVDVQCCPTFSTFGDNMASWARKRGIKGIVIDGPIRDLDGLKKMTDFPVYGVGVQPNGPFHHGGGEIGYDICCGGQVVHPGDIICGDSDGIVVINPDDAEYILEKTKKVVEKIEKSMKAINEGTWNREWVDKQLVDLGCEFIN